MGRKLLQEVGVKERGELEGLRLPCEVQMGKQLSRTDPHQRPWPSQRFKDSQEVLCMSVLEAHTRYQMMALANKGLNPGNVKEGPESIT